MKRTFKRKKTPYDHIRRQMPKGEVVHENKKRKSEQIRSKKEINDNLN